MITSEQDKRATGNKITGIHLIYRIQFWVPVNICILPFRIWKLYTFSLVFYRSITSLRFFTWVKSFRSLRLAFYVTKVQKIVNEFSWWKQIILNFMNSNNASVIFVGLSNYDLISNFSLQTSWWGRCGMSNQKLPCSRFHC